MERRDFLQGMLAVSGLLGAAGLTELAAAQQSAEAQAGKAGKIIDAYCHFSSMKLIDFLEETSKQRPHVFRDLFANTPSLINADKRFELMDECGIDVSVFVPLPWLETSPPVYADPKLCATAAKLFNDEVAEIVNKHSNRLMGVALLPTTTPEVMVAELERAVRDLHFVGGFFVVGPTVKPPDHQDYEYLYQKAVELDVPLWIHPSRPAIYPDYVGEKVSEYQIWQTLSWLMDSSAAMVRLVFHGVYDRYPNLKLIIHHHGALIPLFAQRMQYGWEYFEQNTGKKQETAISSPYIEHFKNFYCDTATQGKAPLLLQMTYDFFGRDRLLFGSDAPMDATSGRAFTMDARASVDGMTISEEDRQKIYSGNLLKLLRRG